jgi:prolyl 4-hydroxylase
MDRILQELQRRRIMWIDDFINVRTCSRVLEELEFTLWRPSTVITRSMDGSTVITQSSSRVSETAMQEWFSDDLKREIGLIEGRLVRILSEPRSKFEAWQAIRYMRGGKFDYHHDAGYWKDEAAADRRTTILIYLSTPVSGGSTRFRHLDLDIEARAGRLVLWRNLLDDGECDPRMLHCSVPLKKGRKFALVTWIRERTLDQRVRRGGNR